MSTQEFTMPGLSDTMQSGHLVRWLKQPGDKINKGDVIAEVESDKAIMDVEAFGSGYLTGPLAQENSDYPVGAVLAYLSDEAGVADQQTSQKESTATEIDAQLSSAATTAQSASDPAPTHEAADASAQSSARPAPHPASHHASGKHRVSPFARGLAQELGIDLASVPANAMGIIKSPQVIAAALRGPQPDLDAGPPWRYKLFTPMHRAVADHMQATVSTPSFHVSANIGIEALHQLAQQKHLSFTLLLARVLALTTLEHPNFNAAYTPFGLALRDRVDVGIAVDMPAGLVTPVLRDMAQRPLDELAKEWSALKKKVLRQRLQPQDYQGATIYLSNLGMFEGITRFDAIVPSGASAILALGAAHDGIADATITADHRVVYGADAARFLQTLNKKLALASGSPEAIISP